MHYKRFHSSEPTRLRQLRQICFLICLYDLQRLILLKKRFLHLTSCIYSDVSENKPQFRATECRTYKYSRYSNTIPSSPAGRIAHKRIGRNPHRRPTVYLNRVLATRMSQTVSQCLVQSVRLFVRIECQ